MGLSASLEQLVSIASHGFDQPHRLNAGSSRLPNVELETLLSSKNGFFAFEQALRVFPTSTVQESFGVFEWNSLDLWRSEYVHLSDNHFFFAEDIFGVQFSLKDNEIYTFDPETGEAQHLANDLDEWAQKLLLQYDVLTGHKIAHDWQSSHGKLPARTRLVPKKPFVLGGDFYLTNLVVMDGVAGMKARGRLATLLRDLPDGTKIKFEITT